MFWFSCTVYACCTLLKYSSSSSKSSSSRRCLEDKSCLFRASSSSLSRCCCARYSRRRAAASSSSRWQTYSVRKLLREKNQSKITFFLCSNIAIRFCATGQSSFKCRRNCFARRVQPHPNSGQTIWKLLQE